MREVLHVMFSEDTVNEKIAQMAEKINRDYEGRQLRLICILKGSVFFCCELAKHLTVPVTIDFMSVSSYGGKTYSSGSLHIGKELDESIEGIDCLVVEDIIDTGNTLARLKELLLEYKPKSLKLCTLLDKPERRETEVEVDYVGFVIPDEFVVGCGLDYAQRYRNLPYIAILRFDEK